MNATVKPRPRYDFPFAYEHGKYRAYYLMHHPSEAQVQADILALLHAYKVDGAAVDAGGKRARGRLAAAARHRGVNIGDLPNITTPEIQKGWADIEATLAPDGRALFIEVKHPRWVDGCGKTIRQEGQPSQEQLEWLREKQSRGALVMVAWAADDVESHLQIELHRNRKAMRERTTPIYQHRSGQGRPETR